MVVPGTTAAGGARVFSLTSRARARLSHLTAGAEASGVRVRVLSKGCSSMSYDVQLVSAPKEGDVEVYRGQEGAVWIEKSSFLYLIGSTMDFEDKDPFARVFKFINPNETGACACGESFTIQPAGPDKRTI